MKGIIKWLRVNLPTLIISLLLALIVWVIASQQRNPAQQRNFLSPIPIEVIEPETGLVVTNGLPSNVTRVTLFLQDDVWRELSTESFNAQLDLSDLGPGTHTVPVEISGPDRVNILGTRPQSVEVEIDEFVLDDRPIDVVLNGEPAVGFRLEDPIIEPRVVTLTGPASLVNQVATAQVVVDLGDGARQDYSETLPVVLIDEDGDPINAEDVDVFPSDARVSIGVEQEPGFIEVSVQPAFTAGRPAQGFNLRGVTPIPATVTLQGPPSELENIDQVLTELIDLTNLTEDQRLEVGLQIPPGVEVVNGSTVEVVVNIEPVLISREVTVPVEVVGLEEGVTADISAETLTVILFGPQNDLEALTPSQNIVAVVDLEGLTEESTVQIEPQVEVVGNDAIEVTSVIPNVLTVDIIPEEEDDEDP